MVPFEWYCHEYSLTITTEDPKSAKPLILHSTCTIIIVLAIQLFVCPTPPLPFMNVQAPSI